MLDHAVAENEVELSVTKLRDIARIAFDDVKRVMTYLRALKDLEHPPRERTGQVQERYFEGRRHILPNRRRTTKIEHSHPLPDFDGFDQPSHPAPPKERRKAWKQLVEDFEPNATLWRHRSHARVGGNRLSEIIPSKRFHRRLHQSLLWAILIIAPAQSKHF
jgi:hypothetical protein